MTREEITELFIRAAETDRRLPFGDGPKPVKAQALPYVHDAADQAGWGGERYAEERESFWESRSTRVRASDVTDWERCNELILAVEDESERRCLWHWAIGRAGGRPFKHWCRDEGIHVETGRRRKERAITRIALGFLRKPLHNNENAHLDLLRVAPVIEHIPVNIEEPAHSLAWMDDSAFSPAGVPELRDFTWAQKRNERRRLREAKKKDAA
jgi:hypothetical protein